MKNQFFLLKIGTQLKLGLLLPVFFVILLGSVSYINSNDRLIKTKIYDHALLIERSIGTLYNCIYAQQSDMKDVSLDTSAKDIEIEMMWIKWWRLQASASIDTIYKEYHGPGADVDSLSLGYAELNKLCYNTIDLMGSGNRNEALNRTRTNGIISVNVQKLLEKLDKINKVTIKYDDRLFLNIIEFKNSHNKKLLFLIAIILLFSIILNTFLVNKIIRPIEDLTEAAKRFHNGDLNARSSYNSGNEFGVLSSSFNEMVDSIKIQNEEKDLHSAELINANNELKQFAYISSHQLQHPLRTIKNFVQIFEEDLSGKLDKNAMRHLNIIKESTERMNSLIVSLSDFSRLGQNKQLSKVDIKRLIDNVLADLHNLLELSDPVVEVREMPVLNAYEVELGQVFQNLIVNAIKFRRKETRLIIKISSEQVNGKWRFSVSDNGIGIAPDQFPKLFNMFYRLHSDEKEYEGKGIGLAFSKKIIELHNGEIWVEPNEIQGVTFFFTIPNLTL